MTIAIESVSSEFKPKLFEVIKGKNRASIATEAFKTWFGDSKVVDAEGRPLIVYHATSAEFLNKPIEVFDTLTSDLGSHFGSEEQVHNLQGWRTYLHPVYLAIQNPLRLTDYSDFNPKSYLLQGVNYNLMVDILGATTVNRLRNEHATDINIQALLMSKGFDGVVYLNRWECPDRAISSDEEVCCLSDTEFKAKVPKAEDSYIAFLPTQVKSVFNSGAFSLRNSNIYC